MNKLNQNAVPASATKDTDPLTLSAGNANNDSQEDRCQLVDSLGSQEAGSGHHYKTGLAWCAGFLDGEGCVTLARVKRTCGNRTNYRARVYVPQNCLETLLTFRDRVAEECCLFQLPHRESFTRPVYQLSYDGIHAYRLLSKLRPYLLRKGAEADVLFEYFRTGEPSRHFGPKGAPAAIWHARERCYDALRCLK